MISCMIRLPRKSGFSQRHSPVVESTPYLKCDLTHFKRSPVTLASIRNDLLQYRNSTSRPDCKFLDLAIHYATQHFRLPTKVPMIHLNDIFTLDLPIWKSSPGLPWKDHGYKVKDDIRNDPSAIQRIRHFWHRVKYGENIRFPDSCAFVRSHLIESGEKPKVRAVWGYPATITFGEAMYAIPLIEAYQKGHSPIAYGFETSIGGASKIRRECRGVWKYALDFSSFDKTVPSWLIRVAFDILALNIDFTVYRGYGVADASKNLTMYDKLVDYFINTSIRLSNGERYRKRSGVASGSYFTQLVDSVVNYILILWMSLRLSGCLPTYCKVFGDDSIFSLPHRVSLKLVERLFSSVGMRINTEKSAISKTIDDLSFLGYKINNGLPFKPYIKWVAALIFPESRDKCWDDVASRAVGLLYANSGVCSAFDGLCRAIVNHSPFKLNFARGFQRMLDAHGIVVDLKNLPTTLEFLRRLKVI